MLDLDPLIFMALYTSMIRLQIRASIFEVRMEVSLAPNCVKMGTENLEQVWKGWAH